MKPKRIVIAGLGLMGGSLAAACRRKLPGTEIVGVTRSKPALAYARRKGWIDHGSHSMEKTAAGADLVILCTPLHVFRDTLLSIDAHSRRPVLVTDVGSVKGEIMTWVRSRKWRFVRFIGSHPMVGSHEQGVQAANPHLYDDGLIFMIRPSTSLKPAWQQVRSFWTRFSKRIAEVTARDHDRIVSEISHLPHALACCLMLTVNKKSLPFAASGFRDTTRIAAAPPSVWNPIFLSNSQALTYAISGFEKELKALKQALRSGNIAKLKKMLEISSVKRLEI